MDQEEEEKRVEDTRRLRRFGGVLLALAGVPFLLAGILHPHGKGSSFE